MTVNNRVLFVCHGNICRSPLAEGVLNYLARKEGIGDELAVDSAGVIAFHVNEPPDARMSAVARSHGIVLTGRARQFVHRDLTEYELVLAMDSSNYAGMCRIAESEAERARVKMFLSFDPEQDDTASVPDPYYGGKEGFERVFTMVMRGCKSIVAQHRAGTLITG